ncbi:hypothetical protein LTS03_011629 [Exophiala xenobiotica]|nr:hypothetical protein LTR72_011703 [Exophiala xenobiotica]KAK5243775.1 hypothetical protein LTS06_010536 [Exophiala xenobiotica]KAK5285257.1 hypothetical protein LTR14_011125 [Exophiala xenobiotica]KAK5344680.1 hypothetical protein LTR61_011556 [Exophiala xenobiotica]KAK5357338.1 hypothetical protein LTS03_011629 [Exophiala xenobiotica]
MPLYLFKNRNYVVLSLCASVATAMFYGLNIIWPQQISALYAGSGKSGAWMACTLTAGVIFGQALGSLLVKRIGKTKWQLVVACCILTAFSSGMAGITEKTKGMAIAFSCISSTMIGYLDIICLAGAILEVDAKDIGLASGVAFTFRTALSSLADSIYVSILENKIKSNVPKYCIPAALSEGLPKGSLTDLLTAVDNGTASSAEAVPGMTPSILAAVSKGLLVAYEKSFQMIYFAAISFGLVAIISAGLSSNVDSKLTTEIARKLQGFRQASDKIDEAKGGSIELERQ